MHILYRGKLVKEACRGKTDSEIKEYCTANLGEDLDINAAVQVKKKARGQTFLMSTEVGKLLLERSGSMHVMQLRLA